MHPLYQLGIDLGTTWTAASICRNGAPPENVTLGTAGSAIASVAFLAADGTMLTGEPALRRALAEPARVVREFKRRIGDGTPLVVGGQPVPAEVISARFVARVVAEVADREGGPAGAIAVTHPVEWGEHKKRSFAAALADEGLPDVLFLTEPQAAAIAYASTERVEPGRTIGVYDLGGGTFDAAVVRKAADGTFELLGRPTGIERLGGVDFDDAVFSHVRDAVGEAWAALDPDDPAVQTAVAGLRRECTAAKETLSADTEAMIPVMLPGLHTMVRLGRAEFEDMIRPAITETVEALRRAIASGGVEPGELDAVLLVGGSSRIPLVSQLVSAELGRPVSVDVDPKAVVAAGAALAARQLHAPVADDEPGLDESSRLDEAPESPPLAFDAAPGAEAAGAPQRRRPRTGVLAGAAAAVAVVFALSASVASGVAPVAPLAEEPVAETAPVDPWTGDALPVGTSDPGEQAGTPEAVTTPAGPRRVRAVAAAVRPVARNVPTGATGARRAVPVAPAPGVPAGGPPANGGGTRPGGSTTQDDRDDRSTPPDDGGSTPPDDNGGSSPPDDNGGNTPPDDNGGNTPPDDNGGNTPPDDGGSTPPDDAGGTPPDNNSGGTPPGAAEPDATDASPSTPAS